MKKNLTIIILLITYSVFGQVWTIYNTSNSDISFNEITDIEFDSQGNKWITSNYNTGGNGIAKFDDTNWTIFNTQNQQGTTDVHRIEFTAGTLETWVSCDAQTTIYFANGTQSGIDTSYDYDNNILIVEIPINAVNFEIDFYIENSSSVQMEFYNVTTGNILQQETINGQMNYEFDYTFFSNIITNQVIDIAIDNFDNKWIGTWQNGLMKFDDVNWINYTTENSGLPNNNINCVVTDNDNNIWIGTPSGLTKFDGTNWITYDTTNSDIPDNYVKAITLDSNNHKWLITGEWSSNGKLTEFENTWVTYDNAPTNWLRKALIIDTNDTKWIGASWGFMSFDGNNWNLVEYDYSEDNNCLLGCQTESIAFDLNNNLWVGSFQECSDGGLLNFSNCNAYQTTNSELPNNNITALKIDAQGNKWIGTSNGLAKLETETLGLENFETDLISIYPNPISDNLTITIKDNLLGSNYSILNSLGQVIKKGNLNTLSTNISFDNTKNGIFYFKLLKNKELKTYKIVK